MSYYFQRRPSLQTQDDYSLHDIAEANFPEDVEVKGSVTNFAPEQSGSPFGFSFADSSSSASSHGDDNNSESSEDGGNSDSDSDSDVGSAGLLASASTEEYEVVNGFTYRKGFLLNVEKKDTPYIPATMAPLWEQPSIKAAPVPEFLVAKSLVPAKQQRAAHPAERQQSPDRFRHARTSTTPILSSESDQEGDFEDDATDDEYCPSPPLNPRKRPYSPVSERSSRRSGSSFSSSSFVTASEVSSATSPRAVKRNRLPPPPRNRPARNPAALQRAVRGEGSTELSYVCPECDWKQTNRRKPDFQRHVRTHIRGSNTDHSVGWWCKGVRIEDRVRCGVPDDAEEYNFAGQSRVGGCMKTFSRRDALKRHLDNKNVQCIGRATPAGDHN